MNMDYIHAAKVVADFLQSDDTAYENEPDMAMTTAKSIISVLQSAGFALTHGDGMTRIHPDGTIDGPPPITKGLDLGGKY